MEVLTVTTLLQMAKLLFISMVALLVSGCIFQRKICEATVEIPKDVIITEKLMEIKARSDSEKLSTSSVEIPIAIIGIASEYIKLQNNKKDKIIYKVKIYDNGTKNFEINLNMPNVILNSKIENFKKEKENEEGNN